MTEIQAFSENGSDYRHTRFFRNVCTQEESVVFLGIVDTEAGDSLFLSANTVYASAVMRQCRWSGGAGSVVLALPVVKVKKETDSVDPSTDYTTLSAI
jgi:hypothetical protein